MDPPRDRSTPSARSNGLSTPSRRAQTIPFVVATNAYLRRYDHPCRLALMGNNGELTWYKSKR